MRERLLFAFSIYSSSLRGRRCRNAKWTGLPLRFADWDWPGWVAGFSESVRGGGTSPSVR
jgi:hypothetical protein